MAKRSKIVISIVIALACVTFCFLPIVASASVASDTAKAPVCPILYCGYDYGASTNVRSVGGYTTTNPVAYNTVSSWYMYCYQTTENSSRHPQLFGQYQYADYGFGFNKDSIYYGVQSIRNGEVSLNFACMNTENFAFFVDFADYDEGTPFKWSTVPYYVDVDIELRDNSNVVVTEHIQMFYSDFVASRGDSGFWVYLDVFCRYYGIDISDKYVTNLSITPHTQSADVAFLTYIRIPSATQYINERRYERNFYDMGLAGYDTGFDAGYISGFNDGADFEEKGVFAMITDSIGGFLMFEIWEGFTIGTLLMICMSVPLFVWIVKLLAGG